MARRHAAPHFPFVLRHIGARGNYRDPVLAALGLYELEDLADAVVPAGLPTLPPFEHAHPLLPAAVCPSPRSSRPCDRWPPSTIRTSR